MAETSIEWANRSWNFLAGCTILTPGCTNCYAMRQAARIERMSPDLAHYHGLTKPSKAGPVWTGKIGIAEAKLLEPLRVRKPRKWFVNSMSDLFHEDVPEAIIDKAFAVMALCPHHTFQILTKRSARMREYLADLSPGSQRNSRIRSATAPFMALAGNPVFAIRFPLPNVWLGVSVEDQKRADERIPDLLATPAAVRWISAEPLLGSLDLGRLRGHGHAPFITYHDALEGARHDGEYHYIDDPRSGPRLDWVVVGGESGRGARPMHPDWVRSIRDQCAAAGVPFFFKQWGEWGPIVSTGGTYGPAGALSMHTIHCSTDRKRIGNRCFVAHHGPDNRGTILEALGKGRAGRTLDGREHNEFPGAQP